MFGKNKNDSPSNASSSNASSSNALNSLVNGTTIEGKIVATNDLRIDGSVIGNLECKGKLIIGKNGSIEGEIHCDNAVVEGKIQGTIRVKNLLHLKPTAFVDGEVKTGQMVVDPGGIMNGNCEMGSQKIKNMPLDNAKVGS